MTVALFIASLAWLLTAAMVLVRSVPAQNVAFIILFLGAVEAALECRSHAGNLQDGVMFWSGAIILLRTAGQGVLKPWRQRPNYGLFLIGLTSLATAVLQRFLDSVQVAGSRFCVTAICLIILAPWFLQKRITASGESTK